MSHSPHSSNTTTTTTTSNTSSGGPVQVKRVNDTAGSTPVTIVDVVVIVIIIVIRDRESHVFPDAPLSATPSEKENEEIGVDWAYFHQIFLTVSAGFCQSLFCLFLCQSLFF